MASPMSSNDISLSTHISLVIYSVRGVHFPEVHNKALNFPRDLERTNLVFSFALDFLGAHFHRDAHISLAIQKDTLCIIKIVASPQSGLLLLL